MNIYNLNKDDLYKDDCHVNPNNCNMNLDFYSKLNEYGIYNNDNYYNIRPILKEFQENYNIEQTKQDYNRDINLQKIQEQNEISKNIGEISISKDPRITEYVDTYSMTPYATYIITPLSDMDGNDVVSIFDSCYGEWENEYICECNESSENGDCHKGNNMNNDTIPSSVCENNDNKKDCLSTSMENTCKWIINDKECDKPCTKIKQYFKMRDPDYKGEDCRDEVGTKLNNNDSRTVYCNHNENIKCSGHGECTDDKNTCDCYDNYSGNECDVPP